MPMRRPRALSLVLLACALPSAVFSQDAEEEVGQLLTDLDAMIIGTQVTTRCALYDSSLAYLTPLEAAAVDIRRREVETVLAGAVEDLADEISVMRDEANAIACGAPGLEPFLDFNRQIARDVTDIALIAWQGIEIDRCAYFADDEFMAAVGRAKAVEPAMATGAEPERAAYLNETAEAWVNLFNENCFSLGFEPTQTLPGLIALALPIE